MASKRPGSPPSRPPKMSSSSSSTSLPKMLTYIALLIALVAVSYRRATNLLFPIESVPQPTTAAAPYALLPVQPDTMSLVTKVINPTAPHTHTIIMMHGRGDTAANFHASLQSFHGFTNNANLFAALPSVKWIFPQAPDREMAAHPGHAMPQWFDIWNIARPREREDVLVAGIQESIASVKALINAELASAPGLAGRYSRIILAGFSQGAAISAHTLMNIDVPETPDAQPRQLGAIVCFSGRLPLAGGRKLPEVREILAVPGAPADTAVIRNTPILMEHNADDGVLPIGDARYLRDMFREAGATVEWKEYPRGGHSFTASGLLEAKAFLDKIVGSEK